MAEVAEYPWVSTRVARSGALAVDVVVHGHAVAIELGQRDLLESVGREVEW